MASAVATGRDTRKWHRPVPRVVNQISLSLEHNFTALTWRTQHWIHAITSFTTFSSYYVAMQPDAKAAPFVPGVLHNPVRCRWALQCSTWSLSDSDKQYFLSHLPSQEQAACTRLRWAEDQKRAIASRVLQRILGSVVFNKPISSVQISRTLSGKPIFLETIGAFGDVNFNVSHEVLTDWYTCKVADAGHQMARFPI
jgi:hypothetical protein